MTIDGLLVRDKQLEVIRLTMGVGHATKIGKLRGKLQIINNRKSPTKIFLYRIFELEEYLFVDV